jgi:hypothetical protein
MNAFIDVSWLLRLRRRCRRMLCRIEVSPTRANPSKEVVEPVLGIIDGGSRPSSLPSRLR